MLVNRNKSGFTIVELLIVIVVIAILAAVSIVAYNGIQQRARASASSSALSQAGKLVKTWQVDNENTSPTCAKFYELVTKKTDSTACSFDHNGTNYQYTPGTSGSYCATATNGNVSYRTNDGGTPISGGCGGHGQNGSVAITNLVTNPSFETNMTSWTDNGGRPISQNNSWASSGARSLSVTNNTGGASTLFVRQNILIPANPGEVFTAVGTVRADTASQTVNIRIDWRDATNTNNLGTVSSSQVLINTGDTLTVRVTGTAPASAGGLRVGFISSNSPASSVLSLDSIMLSIGNNNYNFADGNSANWIWNGSANNSSSTGPAL